MTDPARPTEDWLLIDIDGEDVHFGTFALGSDAGVDRYRAYRSGDHATATDCIMHYAREVSLLLQGRRAAVVVSGAVGADSIRVARSRWIVSKTGLELLFGARPVFLNDSVAKAWANVALRTPVRIVGGERQPDFAAPGKTVVLNYATGLGGAVIHVPENGAAFVTETECGHIGFAPETDLERELCGQLARLNPRVTYERVLTLDRDDPVWNRLSRPVAPAERDLLRAAVLGAFAGDLVLAYTAWGGVFLDGERCGFLADAATASAFNERFADKGHFRMNVRAAPRWLAPASAHNLNGVAHMLATSH